MAYPASFDRGRQGFPTTARPSRGSPLPAQASPSFVGHGNLSSASRSGWADGLAAERSLCLSLREKIQRAIAQDESAGKIEAEVGKSLSELRQRRSDLQSVIHAAKGELQQSEQRLSSFANAQDAQLEAASIHTKRVSDGYYGRANDISRNSGSQCGGDRGGGFPNGGIIHPGGDPRSSQGHPYSNYLLAEDKHISADGTAGQASSNRSAFLDTVVPWSGALQKFPLSQLMSPVGQPSDSISLQRHMRYISVGRPVGLPNRSNDCFWLAALQCLRHSPNFPRVLSAALPASHLNTQPQNLNQALAKLLLSMELAESDGAVHADCEALAQFREFAMQTLPASDGTRKLVQKEQWAQRQQDTHEFLNQLLDYLGGAHDDSEVLSPRCDPDKVRLEAVEKELTGAAKINASNHDNPEAREWAKKTAYNLLYEYCMIQWSASSTRMRSRAMGSLFEGQRLASISCNYCGRFAPSCAEPFTVEEVKLADVAEDPGWLSQFTSLFGSTGKVDKVTLVDVLKQSAENPTAEGYVCPNPSCKRVGTSARKARLFRMPATLVLHVNRALVDGSRCDVALEFQQTLNLNSVGMVVHFGQPLDRNLEPCETTYTLFGAVFHKGPTARSGHYFAYVLFENNWVRIDDHRVVHPLAPAKATPMALEASEPAEGARVALLFYKRGGQP
eukprot:TRINITY_DN24688_c0_g1_i1.p1 TRINITY_DN24688_c0_g1~~TRINITY_DN24688_c0_g1_i1.p1  ORF type:complete len:674 (+),score=85.72 TRINITY_DN24688_c0_g1_i1:114-2135(+)